MPASIPGPWRDTFERWAPSRAESLPRARALYETAGSLLGVPEFQQPGADVDPLAAQLPPNPVLAALRRQVDASLAKLRSGRNIAGLERQVDGLASRADASVVVRRLQDRSQEGWLDDIKRLVRPECFE